MPGSNVGGHRLSSLFSLFASVSAGRSVQNYAMTAFPQIFSLLLFTAVKRCTVPLTDSVIKQATGTLMSSDIKVRSFLSSTTYHRIKTLGEVELPLPAFLPSAIGVDSHQSQYTMTFNRWGNCHKYPHIKFGTSTHTEFGRSQRRPDTQNITTQNRTPPPTPYHPSRTTPRGPNHPHKHQPAFDPQALHTDWAVRGSVNSTCSLPTSDCLKNPTRLTVNSSYGVLVPNA
jgi:hypothetical protein